MVFLSAPGLEIISTRPFWVVLAKLLEVTPACVVRLKLLAEANSTNPENLAWSKAVSLPPKTISGATSSPCKFTIFAAN